MRRTLVILRHLVPQGTAAALSGHYTELKDHCAEEAKRAFAGEVAARDEKGYCLATFAGGCFWGPQILFDRVEGVVATTVGYVMGDVDAPDYGDVCTGQTGHTEGVQVHYDDKVVSFEKLCEVFWEHIDPTVPNGQGNDYGPQYRTGVYFHTEEQGRIAQASKEKVQKHLAPTEKDLNDYTKVYTEVLPAKVFWPAEPEHQNYLLNGGRFGDAQSNAKGCKDPIRCYG